MKHFLACVLLVAGAAAFGGELKIDADFPGGNVIVDGVDGNTVRLRQDLRDTAGFWFYWSFRVRGGEGRALDFEFKDGVIGARGPAVSVDGGLNWRWLSDRPDFSNKKFRYEFSPDEKDVLFGMGMNYTGRDLNRFLEKYGDRPELNCETLCKTKKGRDVELLRIPGKGKDAGFKVFLSSRNHCCEMMANYAMEGAIETILSDSEDGTWLREYCDFFIVPLVDKDGVEDGDQGKNRKPHDHNRDYVKKIHPEVAAITEQVPKWLDGKPVFVLDMHCPGLRGGGDGEKPEKGTNEYFYQVGSSSKNVWEMQKRFGKILEETKRGSIPYKASYDLPYGKSWNKASNTGSGLMKCGSWGATLPRCVFASSVEIPYANSSGMVVDADSARRLGRDLARAIRVYLQTSEK